VVPSDTWYCNIDAGGWQKVSTDRKTTHFTQFAAAIGSTALAALRPFQDDPDRFVGRRKASRGVPAAIASS
jgi:hypothetical protein